MNSAPIRADGASGKPRCRPSWTPPTWRAKNKTWHALRDRRHQQSRSGGHPPRQIEQLSGQVATSTRYDCEYRRNGTANLFVFLDAHRSWRHVKVTDQRTAQDFAVCMRDLADIHYPDADQIRVVMDNLSTHTAGALYEAFPAPEAHRILQRLEFHYTPKHASWLNMVEIEIGVLRGQCLDRRIGEREVLVSEIDAWRRQR